MGRIISLHHGYNSDDGATVHGVSGAVPIHDTILANEGETLASLAMRGYGANTESNRNKIKLANARLSGKVTLPRG